MKDVVQTEKINNSEEKKKINVFRAVHWERSTAHVSFKIIASKDRKKAKTEKKKKHVASVKTYFISRALPPHIAW